MIKDFKHIHKGARLRLLKSLQVIGVKGDIIIVNKVFKNTLHLNNPKRKLNFTCVGVIPFMELISNESEQ